MKTACPITLAVKGKEREGADKGPYTQGYNFSNSQCTDVKAEPLRRLRTKELML